MAAVEPATSDDLDALADCWVELVADQRRHGTHLLAEPNRGVARDVLAQYVVAGDVLVAREAGRVVGFAMFHVETGLYDQDAVRGVVDNLYVRPEARGRGLGSALLAAAEDALVEAGADVVGLSAMAENEAARRFYADRGYEPRRVTLEKRPAGESDNHSKDGE